MSEKHRKEAGQEPDYRFTLANERTFLSWIRTALALLAAAVAVVQLMPDLGTPYLRKLMAAGLAVTSMMIVLGGIMRWRSVQRAMRHHAELPATRLPWLIAAGLAAVSMLLIVLTLTHAA